MRSYEQFCAVAKALDVVGDRWTLLIVRELLQLGPSRYTDLKAGLPGIATNLLATRLREMEEQGVVTRTEAPPPVAATLFDLTPWGHELELVLLLLAKFGSPMVEQMPAGDAFRAHWLRLPAEFFLRDHQPDQPQRRLRVTSAAAPDALDIVVGDGVVSARLADPREHPHVTIDGPPPVLVGLLSGRLTRARAARRGLRVTGDRALLDRLLPVPAPGEDGG